MADLGLLAGIAEGLKQGLGSYMQVKQAKEESRRQAEDQALKQRMAEQQSEQFEYQKQKDAAELERQYRTGGFKQDEAGNWNPDYGFLAAKTSLDPNKQMLQALQMQKAKQDIEAGKLRADEAKMGKSEERQAALYGNRMRTAHEQAKQLEDSFHPESNKAYAQGFLPEVFKPADLKKYENSKRNFVAAVLRKESGAAISSNEYAEGNKLYFPQVGDTPDVIEQKRIAREQAIEGMGLMAGPAKGLLGTDQPQQKQMGLVKSEGKKQNAAPKMAEFDPIVVKDGVTYELREDGKYYKANPKNIGTKY